MAAPSRVVSVVPTLNEENHIERCLRSLMEQTYSPQLHKIIVVDGGSDDATVNITLRLSKESEENDGPVIMQLDNPQKYVPQARNIALEYCEDEDEFIFEMNAHAYVDANHIEKRIQDLLSIEEQQGKKIAGVGTRVEADERWSGLAGRWVEGAISSPLGHGGGQFAPFVGRQQHRVPAFVIHRREALIDVNGWGEEWQSNQDSDLSMRLLKNGWELWRSDVSRLKMAKRDSLFGFAKMMFRYGAWRGKSIWVHPKRANPLEFLPLIGLLTICGLALLYPLDYVWTYPIFPYFVALLLIGILQTFKLRSVSMVVGVPISLLIMHTSFTTGLVLGLLRLPVGRHDR